MRNIVCNKNIKNTATDEPFARGCERVVRQQSMQIGLQLNIVLLVTSNL